MKKLTHKVLTKFLAVLFVAALLFNSEQVEAESKSRLSDKPIPMKTDKEMPKRVPPLVEIGNDFLGTGNISSGFELPTGAVWIPSLWVYGNVRTGLNYIDTGGNSDEIVEAVVRSDINFHLNLTGTERLFLQLQPFHSQETFTRYRFEPENGEFSSHINLDVNALFFEGDIGEMFPKADPLDSAALDFGIAIGRQPIFFQEGMMFNDTMDAIGLVRDTLIFEGLIDTKLSFVWGWNNVNRANNQQDANAELYGFFTESDLRKSSLRFDVAYVDSDTESGGDGLFLGFGSVQRIRGYNTAFYANYSHAIDDESAAVRDGLLLFSEISTTPINSHDLLYFNSFIGIDDYSSGSRGRTNGGPVGRTGIMYAGSGMGSFGAALGSNANKAVGAALGYQMFMNSDRTQVIFELAGIKSSADTATVQDGVALGVQYQQKIGERYRALVTAFVSNREINDEGGGVRFEFLTQF